MAKIFSFKKKKYCFEFSIGNKRILIYRYLRMLREIYLYNHYILLRDSLREKFNISLPREAYYHFAGNIILVKMKLKDIYMPCGKGKIPITETKPYKFLATRKAEFIDKGYGEGCVYVSDSQEAVKRMEKLEQDIRSGEGYNPAKSIICLRRDNAIIDGQHRCAALYYVHGGDYEVLVAKET